jgi:aspartate dehydrogenase
VVDAPPWTVSIAGLGAIGLEVARGLDRGIPGLALTAVTARDMDAARARVAGFRSVPAVVPLEELRQADIVVEAAGAALLERLVELAIRHRRRLVVCSVGALLQQPELIEQAREGGIAITVPSGAIGGLDAVRAAAEGEVRDVLISTRKSPNSLAGAPYVATRRIDLGDVHVATCIFRGSAREAAVGFPANLNVGAALALAGIGPDRTRVEIWADPAAERNVHTVTVDAAAVRLTVVVEGMPSPDNPRTSQLTALSVLATLRGLVSPLRVGT